MLLEAVVKSGCKAFSIPDFDLAAMQPGPAVALEALEDPAHRLPGRAQFLGKLQVGGAPLPALHAPLQQAAGVASVQRLELHLLYQRNQVLHATIVYGKHQTSEGGRDDHRGLKLRRRDPHRGIGDDVDPGRPDRPTGRRC